MDMISKSKKKKEEANVYSRRFVNRVD